MKNNFIVRFIVITTAFLFCCLLTTMSYAAETAPSAETIFEIATPEEIAEAMGFPATEYDKLKKDLGDQNAGAGIDVTQWWPIVVLVNKASSGPTAQTVKVWVNGVLTYNWLTSTGREKKELAPSGKEYYSATPLGWFSPTWLNEDHFSETWKAPMPYAIFFNGGIALHATTPSHYDALGKRDSGGCARLHYDNAKILFNLVQNADMGLVPIFKRAGTVSWDATGAVNRHQNWNTLIMVEENYKY